MSEDQSLGELGKVVQGLKDGDKDAVENAKKFATENLGKFEKSDNETVSKAAKEVLGKFEGSTESKE